MKNLFGLLCLLFSYSLYAADYVAPAGNQGNVSFNGGTHTITGTGTITFGNFELKNGATVSIASGVTVVITGKFDNKTGSTVTVDGVLDLDGANNDNKSGGVITGTGDIETDPGAPLVNNGGTVFGDSSNQSIDCSSGGCASGTLPVVLLTANAYINESGIEISWETATELNNDHFTLERSYDGVHFEIITTIEGAGNSSELMNYQVMDIPPAFGLILYRLSQTDYDGTTEVFPLISILYQDLDETKILAYPTRVPADLKEVRINNIWGTVISHDLRVVELNGQVSGSLNLDFDTEDVKILLPPGGKAGLHFLRGTINGVTISEKLIFLN